jgi:phosphoglycerate dehydrogenase-like enzyme
MGRRNQANISLEICLHLYLDQVGVVGLGGLGHMAEKFAHALGARVVIFA